ncbi:MAG: preprotein translocase subunit YajC [Alphaproteobacteria bacterium]
MFDPTQLFISSAWAQGPIPQVQDAAPGIMGGSQSALMGYLPFILIFAVFYFLVIRPQQKKFDEQNKMVKALQRGDRVVAVGGIHGKITKLEGDDLLIVEIAEGVQIKIDRTSVQGLEAKTQPVAAVSDEK